MTFRVWEFRLLLLVVSVWAQRGALGGESVDRAGAAFYEQHIRPVLAGRCYECHSEEQGTAKGGLRLDSPDGWLEGGDRGPAVVAGDPERSLLWQAISGTHPELRMPPGERPRLGAREIEAFRMWIVLGAPGPIGHGGAAAGKQDEALWSLEPVRRPVLPEVREMSGVENPIDLFVLSRLEAESLRPAPRAERRVLIRRIYFDLLGLPPEPEEVEAFVSDESPGAWARLVDALLARPEYGERWARHWLDVARYADSGGYVTDMYYRNAWRYRDYVVRSFNSNKPYDRFIREQIAGDELWPDNLELSGGYEIPLEKRRHLEARLGTGLFALGPQLHESRLDAKKREYEQLTDWVDTVGAAFMGLTLGCARCHDHKTDPISQEDYYGFQAVFAASRVIEAPVVSAMSEADYQQHYPKLLAIDEARRAYLRFEKGLKNQKELTESEKSRKQELLRAIAEAVLALPRFTAGEGAWDGLMEVPAASVLGHREPGFIREVRLLDRGEIDRPRQAVGPRFPQALTEATGGAPDLADPFKRRAALAEWLTDPRHPLTARVIVNRLWQWHFGRGLVATPNDFGRMGESPSHPELLDWLAAELIESGWDLKRLHRQMLLSAAYQRSSRFSTEAHLDRDPDNRLLWRMNRRRLEGEAVWDALHAAAGMLNRKMGGRPVAPPLAEMEAPPSDWVVNADPAEHGRRGIYILARRNYRFPLFEIFDAPVDAVSAGTRTSTTVPPQALWMLNNPVPVRLAREMAARLIRPDERLRELRGGDVESWRSAFDDRLPHLVRKAWKLALGRAPDDTDQAEGIELVRRLAAIDGGLRGASGDGKAEAELSREIGAMAELCLALFNLSEFLYID